MPTLLYDRYLPCDHTRACDLATGDVIRIDELIEPPPSRHQPVPAWREVLDHGRDGQPRSVVADVRPHLRWKDAASQMAADAAARGYVPIAAEMYARWLPIVRDEIADRTLMLIASERSFESARRAFLDAAMRTPRPHVLLTLRTGRTAEILHVREARASYGSRPRIAVPVPSDVVQLTSRARRADEFMASGRHAAAERLLRDVSAALTRRSAWPQAAATFTQLGRLLLERGRPLDAIRAFVEATGTAGSAGDEMLATEARLWIASARTDAGQLTAAEAICRALLLAGRLTDAHRAWTRAALIRVLLWQDRIRDAMDLPDVRSPDSELDPLIHVFVEGIAIRLLIATDRVFEAGVRAGQLVATMPALGSTARVMALTSHLRVLVAAGDLSAAESRLREIRVATRASRTPLRLVRARLIWADALRRAGRTIDADRQYRLLTKVGRVTPPLLRHAIERRVAKLTCAPSPCAPVTSVAVSTRKGLDAAALVRLVQDEDDDRCAVTQVLEVSARHFQATRIDLWSTDAGPATVVQSVGTGLPSTIGDRVLEAGIAIGPDASAVQLGVPVRIGSRLVAALVVRWPVDRIPPSDAETTLELIAAVLAPRIDTLLHQARQSAEASVLIPELVGVSRAIAEVRQAVARAAAAPFAVLVEGESGVGKELIARAVHYLSPRRERRFCDVNCAALPDDLLESELFGHTKGAFTGAVADRAGMFEEAHGGTLFLDEVADLSLRAQAKLLRVLQQQEIRRVGETFTRPVDVRLVAAANRDMRTEAAGGRFRQDLLYRLDVIRITVPPLRERPEDIPMLVQHFWGTAAARVGTSASLATGVFSALATYEWPGNVRELQNVVAALAVAAPRRGRVTADLLPAVVTGATPIRTSRLADARDQFERRFVAVALAQAGGNRTRAAQALGVTRQGLLKLIARLRVGELP